MKKLLSIILCCSTIIGGAASKGAVTEGLFIIQNKHREVKEAIQELKKELTACHTVQSKEHFSELETYHCKLRQLIYPWYIDELNKVIEYADKQLPALEKEPVEQTVLDAAVQRAFTVKQKIQVERELLNHIFEVDRLIKHFEDLKKKHSRHNSEEQNATQLDVVVDAIKKGKQAIAILKRRIQDINGTIFNGTLTQEVFFDKLAFYNA